MQRFSRALLRSTPLLLLLAALLAPACRSFGARSSKQPNVVLILADDLGWGELGCYGQTKIQTPALDALARQGVRFTQAYSGAPVCAPSRCSLLTGMHTGHSAIRDNKELEPEGQEPLPAGIPTLAELLHARGYATAAIGKWGLGPPGSVGDPLRRGFDHFFGYNCQRAAHTYYPEWLYRDRTRVALPGNDPQKSSGASYSPDLMREEALEFVRKNADRPFFLYYATTVPHVALQVPEDSLREYAGKFPEKPYDGKRGYTAHATPRAAYAAMITRLDHDVGVLLAELDKLGLAEDTLFVFTSDNGPTYAGGVDAKFFDSTAGLRGLKGELYEGGIREPLIVRWPGHTQAGRVENTPCAGWDLMPTLAAACGAHVPEGLDGVNLVPLFEGGAPPPRDFLYWETADMGGWQAVRMGDWKAVRRNLKKNIPGPIEVYDLAQDPDEMRDVSMQHPDIAKRARAAFATRTTSPIAEWNFTPAK
ncbi:MAG: arylsulfatase [Planctomycetes bacterium]|nr:arylsulfatase [Planctomycetota bacterium]